MTLAELLSRGGVFMLPLYLCAGAALCLFFYKALQFRAARLDQLAWVDGVMARLAGDDVAGAQHALAKTGHPGARAIEAALTVANERPGRTGAEAARCASLQLQHFEGWLGGLSFIAQIAPMLGLLGTVAGLVQLFMDLEQSPAGFASGELSTGMWTALLTTAAGLAIALVALAGHQYLTSRADRLRLTLHDICERALTALEPRRTDR